MKNGLKIFLVFAVVLVLALAISGVFKTEKVGARLSVDTINTTVIVKDDMNNVLSNEGAILVVGDTYTVEIIPNTSYELSSLRLNNASIINELDNLTYTFVCNGSISLVAVSTYIQTIEPETETCSVTFFEIIDYFNNDKNHQYLQVMIYDINDNLVACLNYGESCELLKNEKYFPKGFYKGKHKYSLAFNMTENLLHGGAFQLEHDIFLKMVVGGGLI